MTAAEKIANALRSSGSPRSARELIEWTGLGRAQVKNALQRSSKTPGGPSFERVGMRGILGRNDEMVWRVV